MIDKNKDERYWKKVKCALCDKVVWRRIGKLRRTQFSFCNNECKNRYFKDNSPSWKGGRVITGDGYVVLKMRHHHRANVAGYVKEHIVVLENILGRPITKGEVVHHINGIRSDNRPENLSLFSGDRDHYFAAHVNTTPEKIRKSWDGRRNRDKSPNVSCDFCGKRFYVNPYSLNHQKHFYCSRSCQGSDWNNLTKKKQDIINQL